MTTRRAQPWAREARRLLRRQHGVVTRAQLLAAGMPAAAIRHRLAIGRLHQLHRGVYAYGRPDVSRLGQLMAAVLACGPSAQLSHRSGAELWRIRGREAGPIDVTVPRGRAKRVPKITRHRRVPPPRRHVDHVPVGDPFSILVDLATCLEREEVEDAVNAADSRGLLATPDLRAGLDRVPGRPGTGRLRRILDDQTFSRSQTALERRFLPIALAAGLPPPGAQIRLGPYRVDFHWPELGLVVETDSHTYHRTVAQQTVDMERDQAHVRGGLRTLRFNHHQVFHRPDHVRAVLTDTLCHLR